MARWRPTGWRSSSVTPDWRRCRCGKNSRSSPCRRKRRRSGRRRPRPRRRAELPERRILLGVIGRAHGVRGLVRVTSYTGDPTALTGYGPLSDASGRQFTLRWMGEGVAELFEVVDGRRVKIADRTAAERLV